MKTKLLEILVCPKCEGSLICQTTETGDDQEIITGELKCTSCDVRYPIRASIPRFVPEDNYAASFSLQWNLFKFEQIDEKVNANFSEDRFYSETGWSSKWLSGKHILDAGCGAGRFLDIASQNDCEVVGVDISNAVDAAAINMRGRSNVHLVQASIYELPFKTEVFDACYCIGVIQHTPDPLEAIASLPRLVKKGGQVILTIYERKRWTLLNAKYLVRPLTKRMNKRVLLFLIKVLMPIFYPITSVLFRLPVIGRLFKFIIPIADYPHSPGLSFSSRYNCVLLDTFDMLSPQFDNPQSQQDVTTALSNSGVINIRRGKTSGLNMIGVK